MPVPNEIRHFGRLRAAIRLSQHEISCGCVTGKENIHLLLVIFKQTAADTVLFCSLDGPSSPA